MTSDCDFRIAVRSSPFPHLRQPMSAPIVNSSPREESGVLIPAGDPPALAEALARYRDEPMMIANHALAAGKRVVEHFRIDAMLSAYTATYDQVLAQRYRQRADSDRLPSEKH
jgi:hypothetical protein